MLTYLLQTLFPDKIMLQNALVMTTCSPDLPHNYSQVYRESFVTALHRISAFSQCSLTDLMGRLGFETLAGSQQSHCMSSEHQGLKQCGPSAMEKALFPIQPLEMRRVRMTMNGPSICLSQFLNIPMLGVTFWVTVTNLLA